MKGVKGEKGENARSFAAAQDDIETESVECKA
jgi:hypothetical protein